MHSLTRRHLLGLMGIHQVASGARGDRVAAAVAEMERKGNLRLVGPGFWRQNPTAKAGSGPEIIGVRDISSDGSAITYWPISPRAPEDPFIFVETADVVEPIYLAGYNAYDTCSTSDKGAVIVIRAYVGSVGRRDNLLMLDRRSGLNIHDITGHLTYFNVRELERINVAGSGDRVAFGSLERTQIIDIPSGKTVYSGPGRMPKLSPDGTKAAFTETGKLQIVSLTSGATKHLLPGIRTVGAGKWSPDGRFLPAGAWTRRLAFEKRKIVIDITTGDYTEMGTIGEGGSGDGLSWIQVNLLKCLPGDRTCNEYISGRQ